MTRLRVSNFPYVFGGDKPSGWLPPNSSTPEPTPVHEITIDVTVETVEGGALLIYTSQDGAFANDFWYGSVGAALEGAKERFGISRDAWREE
jgi:hypothetical protein